ncbi:MAG: BglI family type II restriction endonuclease [Blastocatellales bacterium]|nr:BglI family type II restriction endonuclease [Blastocatellales bacterium]
MMCPNVSWSDLVSIAQTYSSVAFPGLPFGGDLRFATDDALVHLDIKMTGPNDNANEIVVPPQQISGDGALWSEADGMQNGPFLVKGLRASMNFQPKLPPYYVMNGNIRLCLTYFLKGVYEVEGFGVQPLRHLEIACVPNGLLLFDGPKLAQTGELFIPGKDDRSKAEHDKRTRIRLDPLASLGKWRCTKISKVQDVWKTDFR